MKKYFPFVLIVAAVLTGYYFYAASLSPSLSVTLAMLGDSGVSGSAAIQEDAGGVTVTLNLMGGAEGVDMPAHIHEGACPGVGAVKYPLSSVSNGISVTTIPGATLEDLKGMLPLAINVHKSAAEAPTYVACGSIDL